MLNSTNVRRLGEMAAEFGLDSFFSTMRVLHNCDNKDQLNTQDEAVLYNIAEEAVQYVVQYQMSALKEALAELNEKV